MAKMVPNTLGRDDIGGLHADLLDVTGFCCPVCFFPDLREPYVDCSYSICPSCGVEYGYEDCGVTADDRYIRHLELRRAWITAGCTWHTEIWPCPTYWSLRRTELARLVDAVDPHVESEGTPSTRV